ncbi:MAG TPA: proton-conducting transporter membrane subunit [Candidatus Limnocylindria bacterium]|jgi:formate hydrogenlyase subunit 3/multisubunit Na+/H+ antiporter MnhD subunit|nr:proton-conducting transporter membrane subunit [Candidatus Limnocylindria bacterium]
MTLAAAPLVLAVAACGAFVLRKRLRLVGPFSLLAIAAAFVLVAAIPVEATGTLLDLEMRTTPLGQLASLVILSTLFLLVLDVWIDEPAYNYFPTALAVGATSLGVLVLTAPLAIFALLVLGLLVPVGSFTFQVQRNRSVEAATRHFAFVALGGCLGIGALALSASLPHEQPASTFVLLAVVLVVAFALLLAAIPFHTHAALLASEVPAAALALYFGVLVPTTFIAFVEILTLSGLLPAIVQVVKVQDLLHGIGLVSAVGGAFLASGAPDLRRLVVYSVISNLGAALVGIATLSGPGIIGALASVIVTGASASAQLLAAGTLERRSAPDRPIAQRAPLAALAFVVGGFAMIGAPPLLGFPGRFFMELIAYQFAPITGTLLVAATLLLIVGQLRAVLALFGSGVERWTVEPRPIAGIIGGVIFVALLIGGIQPDGFLRPIASFADEFLKALRPL